MPSPSHNPITAAPRRRSTTSAAEKPDTTCRGHRCGWCVDSLDALHRVATAVENILAALASNTEVIATAPAIDLSGEHMLAKRVSASIHLGLRDNDAAGCRLRVVAMMEVGGVLITDRPVHGTNVVATRVEHLGHPSSRAETGAPR